MTVSTIIQAAGRKITRPRGPGRIPWPVWEFIAEFIERSAKVIRAADIKAG
jgi:hypothetical protein